MSDIFNSLLSIFRTCVSLYPKSQLQKPRPLFCLRTGIDTSLKATSSFCSISHSWICGMLTLAFFRRRRYFFSYVAFYSLQQILFGTFTRTIDDSARIRTKDVAIQTLRTKQVRILLAHVVLDVRRLKCLGTIEVHHFRIDRVAWRSQHSTHIASYWCNWSYWNSCPPCY